MVNKLNFEPRFLIIILHGVGGVPLPSLQTEPVPTSHPFTRRRTLGPGVCSLPGTVPGLFAEPHPHSAKKEKEDQLPWTLFSGGGGGVDLVRPSSTQLTKPFCRAITGGAVGNGDWAVALRQTFKRLKSESEGKKGREETGRPAYLLGEVDEGNVRLGLGTVLVEARPCALEMAASL